MTRKLRLTARFAELWCPFAKRWMTSDVARGKVLGNGGAGEFICQQAGEVHHRGAWPITRYDALGLPSGVALDQHDTADWIAADFSDVVLEPAVLAVRADKLKLLAAVE